LLKYSNVFRTRSPVQFRWSDTRGSNKIIFSLLDHIYCNHVHIQLVFWCLIKNGPIFWFIFNFFKINSSVTFIKIVSSNFILLQTKLKSQNVAAQYDGPGLWLFAEIPNDWRFWCWKNVLPLPIHRWNLQFQIYIHSWDWFSRKKDCKLVCGQIITTSYTMCSFRFIHTKDELIGFTCNCGTRPVKKGMRKIYISFSLIFFIPNFCHVFKVS
jgi:hypothetical protein